jgi:hypothetical protein
MFFLQRSFLCPLSAIASAGSGAGKTTTTTSKTRTATARHHGWFAGARQGVFGTVASVGSGSFTLTTRAGTTVTVNVTSTTTFKDPSSSSASLADVTVGQHVAVTGTDTSNTVAATAVFIGGTRSGRGFRGHGAWGR